MAESIKTLPEILEAARTKYMFDTEGLPTRKACCDTCNYGILPTRLPEIAETHIRDLRRKYKTTRKHRCHSAPGSICFGSHVNCLPTQDDRIEAIEESLFSLRNRANG